jgi:hypothetical protein
MTPRPQCSRHLLGVLLLSIAAPLDADPVQASFAGVTLTFPTTAFGKKSVPTQEICLIDATNAAGITVQAVQDGLKLSSGDGRGVTLRSFDAKFVRISSSRGASWTLRDKLGRTITITDKAQNAFLVINRTDRPLAITEHTKSPRKFFSAPPHSLTMLNNVEYPVTMGERGGGSRFNLPNSPLPLRVIYSDGAQQFQMKTGRTATHTDLGKKAAH